MKQAVIIFVRNPVAGKVKTRIARTAGDAGALRIYEYLLRATQRLTGALPFDKWVFYDGWIPAEDGWSNEAYHKALQQGNSLGERMEAAFQSLFSRGYQQVLIIGSDCPELTPAMLREAAAQLSLHDVVLGPSADGGYYLLGLTALHKRLFEAIDWSTEQVLAQTQERIDALGLTLYRLPLLHDIDEEADWIRYRQQRAADRLLFVYNAGSDLFSEITDWVHKLVSPRTYACSLCALTHGHLGMKQEWKTFLAGLPLRQEFLHSDQFGQRYPSLATVALPAIFVEQQHGLTPLLPAAQINKMNSIEDLEKALNLEIARHDLDHHPDL